jgi:hypothetical protein
LLFYGKIWVHSYLMRCKQRQREWRSSRYWIKLCQMYSNMSCSF